MTLGIELETLLSDLAVEVDCELGYAENGLVVAVQQRLDRTVAAVDGDPAGEAEVAVEPRVQQDTAVHLHADLLETLLR